MGHLLSSNLRFGYAIGGPDYGGWLLKGDIPSWLEDEYDIPEEAEERLLRSVGFLETDRTADGFYERRRAALHEVGVEIVPCGVEDYSDYALVLREPEITSNATWTVVALPTFDEVAAEDLLDTALQTLGLVPTQESPSWLLGPSYG